MAESLRAVEGEHITCCEPCTRRGRYARDVADAMGLRDWTVDVLHGPPSDPSALADIQIVPGRRIAVIRYADVIESVSPDEQRHVTVHEFVHVLVDPFYDTVSAAARDEFGRAAFAVFDQSVRRQLEATIDILTTTIARAVPVPAW